MLWHISVCDLENTQLNSLSKAFSTLQTLIMFFLILSLARFFYPLTVFYPPLSGERPNSLSTSMCSNQSTNPPHQCRSWGYCLILRPGSAPTEEWKGLQVAPHSDTRRYLCLGWLEGCPYPFHPFSNIATPERVCVTWCNMGFYGLSVNQRV